MPDPTPQDLKIDLTRLEGRIDTQEEQMKTHEAETKARVAEYQLDYNAGWQAFLDTMAKRDAAYREAAAKRDADQAKRDTAYREEAAKREADQAKRDADYRADHQAAISALSEKMAYRETRLITVLITVVALAVAFLRFTTPTIEIPPTLTPTTVTTTPAPPNPPKNPLTPSTKPQIEAPLTRGVWGVGLEGMGRVGLERA